MMKSEQTQQNSETLFPVFRFDLENRLIYANQPALPLIKHWHCRINERMPGEVISQYPELFHAALSHRPTDVTIEFNDQLIHFTIVPFPEARYIGMYAYSIELSENFINKQTLAKVPA
jgi:hypothetical protein